jgi:quercetin dioxygenase-like cupin family protein
MSNNQISLKLLIVLSAVLLMLLPAAAQQPNVTRKVLLQQDLNISGYTASLVAVEIPAGSREGRHTHPGTLVGYVQEGTLTLDYEGKPTKTYTAGETFSVEPGKIHEGINKGNTAVKILVTLVSEKGKPLVTPVQ